MKTLKFLVLVLMLIFSLSLQAQTEKGKLWIAGSSQLGLSQGGYKTKIDGDETSNYSQFGLVFQPKIGYTVIKNLPLGVFFNIENSGFQDKEGDYKSRSLSTSGGPFIRYYFADLMGLKPYAEALFGFGFVNSKYQIMGDDWNENRVRLINFSLGAGLTYFINDHIGIDLLLGYNYKNFFDKDEYNDEGEEVERITNMNEFIMQMGMVAMIKCKK
jgi:opacity protein-like surface antigen